MTNRLGWLLVLFAFSLSAQDKAAPLLWSNLELGLGAAKLTKQRYLLDLGHLPLVDAQDSANGKVPVPGGAICRTTGAETTPSGKKTIELILALKGPKTTTIDIAVLGHKVSLPAAQNQAVQSSKLSLNSASPTTLTIEFDPSAGSRYELSGLLFTQAGRVVTSVTLQYLFLPIDESVQLRSKGLLGGPGNAFSATLTRDNLGYQLATGKAPADYTLARACHWLEGDRACGSYSSCDWLNFDDTEVSFTFRMQGHEESRSPKQSEGFLDVHYGLRASHPTLR